ncbi:MAG: alanyl-tRNA editing protein, partial [Clostridia bacterium]|nr:alanyl-tRNA editing protein [Clostridia bacterium]
MAAIRLYYEDAYLTETVTDITACIEEEGRMLVTLKESLFHAQGGGQPADRGTIDGVPVLDVFDREGELYHVVERAPEKREGVVLKLDWDYRYDVMRQHTGQHLLSAAILHRFGVTTTISRGEDFVNQIDLERPLSDEQLREAEREANAVMAEGRKVRGFFAKP